MLTALAVAACSSPSPPLPPVIESLAITAADAIPGQVAAGDPVTLSWSTAAAERATLAEGAGQPADVPVNGSLVVHPTATTVFTLNVYGKPGMEPASIAGRMVARVRGPTSVSGFIATPPGILQGGSSTLSWNGNASRYTIADGTTGAILEVGPRRSVVVRPSVSTTYTLTAVGPGGALANPPKTLVAVSQNPATGLKYDPPTAVAPLELVADACVSPPCTSVTFKILATTAVQLRGAALNLPLDPTKVSFADTSFGLGSPMAAAVSKATLGSGALQDVLVLGIALKGSSTAPAQDVTLNAGDELAHFSLALLSGSGAGRAFDGASPAATAGSPFKASIQSASGRATHSIAVGTLKAE
jgi:hypothetical protein